MRLVADTNVLFTFFWKNSVLKEIMHQGVKLFAPEYSLEEINRHKQEIIDKAKITENEFTGQLYLMEHEVDFVPKSAYEKQIAEIERISRIFSEPEKSEIMEDADFLALAILLHCPLWSNDTLLKKQGKVNVLSTHDVILIVEPTAPTQFSWDKMLDRIKEQDKHFKGKREKIDHDLIAHGVSRDGTTLEDLKKRKGKKRKK